MIRCPDILKQALALAAVLLSLSTQVQHAGVLCRLGACEDALGSVAATTLVLQGDACCHHDGCTADQCLPASPEGRRSAPSHVPCPCPEGCWCQQVPLPLELPKLLAAPDELAWQNALATGWDGSLPMAVERDRSTGWARTLDAGGLARIDPCARFCRFLI